MEILNQFCLYNVFVVAEFDICPGSFAIISSERFKLSIGVAIAWSFRIVKKTL